MNCLVKAWLGTDWVLSLADADREIKALGTSLKERRQALGSEVLFKDCDVYQQGIEKLRPKEFHLR